MAVWPDPFNAPCIGEPKCASSASVLWGWGTLFLAGAGQHLLHHCTGRAASKEGACLPLYESCLQAALALLLLGATEASLFAPSPLRRDSEEGLAFESESAFGWDRSLADAGPAYPAVLGDGARRSPLRVILAQKELRKGLMMSLRNPSPPPRLPSSFLLA